jgi:hypothetical protein
MAVEEIQVAVQRTESTSDGLTAILSHGAARAVNEPLGFLTGERMIVSAERRHDRHRKSRYFTPHKSRQTLAG